MIGPLEVTTDVSGVPGLDGPLHTRASVYLPDPGRVSAPQTVAFAFPGAGYGRGYFSFDPPGSAHGGQAGHHVDRHGWIFVACDPLGVGDSTTAGWEHMTLPAVAEANRLTVEHITRLLADGSLMPGYPPVERAVRIGLGQSMGGCLTIFLQGTRPTFDAVAILGFSATHTVVPLPDDDVSSPAEAAAQGRSLAKTLRYAMHHADVPDDVVAADLTADYPVRAGRMPVWGSATVPGCALTMDRPGVVAEAAAAIEVPVLIGLGEIDVAPEPRAEPAAYHSARDITLVMCPRMAHMHNFAATRVMLWNRVGAWASGITVCGPGE